MGHLVAELAFWFRAWSSLMTRVGLSLATAVVGLLLGFVLAAGGHYLATRWNNTLVISDVHATAEVSQIAHQRLLKVQFHVSGDRECPSWTQHTLYRDMAADGRVQRTVVPLGITVNGLGAPSDKTDFDVPFPLPAAVTAGAWNYAAITSMSCEWLPGLVRQQVQETAPIAVFVTGPA